MIVAVGVLGVAASGWYRSRARERLLQNLGNANLRAEAFSGLLRANGLWGLAQDAVYDPRVPETMSPYLRAQDAGGRVWHVLQISKVDRERNVDGAFVVFDEHGTLEGVFEQTRAVPLLAGPEYALVALVKTSDDQPTKVRRPPNCPPFSTTTGRPIASADLPAGPKNRGKSTVGTHPSTATKREGRSFQRSAVSFRPRKTKRPLGSELIAES